MPSNVYTYYTGTLHNRTESFLTDQSIMSLVYLLLMLKRLTCDHAIISTVGYVIFYPFAIISDTVVYSQQTYA